MFPCQSSQWSNSDAPPTWCILQSCCRYPACSDNPHDIKKVVCGHAAALGRGMCGVLDLFRDTVGQRGDYASRVSMLYRPVGLRPDIQSGNRLVIQSVHMRTWLRPRAAILQELPVQAAPAGWNGRHDIMRAVDRPDRTSRRRRNGILPGDHYGTYRKYLHQYACISISA